MDPPLLRPNTSAGLIRRIPELERLAMDAVEILGLAPGTSNVEFLQSSTGAFFLIEVNGGRHAAQDMNLVHSGINIPEMLLDLAFDKSVEPVADSVIKEGTFCLKYTDEIIIDHGKLKATLREVPL
jgi:predicted ATP-grasp superfamily ATP-dependent carboligase